MASEQNKAERRAKAIGRLQSAKSDIAERLGLAATPPSLNNRDPELAQIQQTEDVAGFLEGVLENLVTPSNPKSKTTSRKSP